MIYAAPVKHSGEREKKLAKDGGGGTAVGTLLNKALLLGNSSNSTRQWGGGYYSEWASAPFTLIHIITRKPRAHAIKGGRLGGFPG